MPYRCNISSNPILETHRYHGSVFHPKTRLKLESLRKPKVSNVDISSLLSRSYGNVFDAAIRFMRLVG